MLFCLLFLIVCACLDRKLGIVYDGSNLGLIATLFVLISFIPSIAVTVRRLHDTNRHGWWMFINFIPLIGSIWLTVLMCLNGDSEDNRFGQNP